MGGWSYSEYLEGLDEVKVSMGDLIVVSLHVTEGLRGMWGLLVYD